MSDLPLIPDAARPALSHTSVFEGQERRLWSWGAIGLMVASTVILSFQFGTPVNGDTELYRAAGLKLLHGQPLYGDVPLEYPPYILPWWVLPSLAGSLHGFIVVFGLELLAVDLGLKWLLFADARRSTGGARALLPLAVWIVGSFFLLYVFLKRFDLVPAALTLFAASLLFHGWPLLSGLLLAAGVGTKVYPLVLLPLFVVVAARQRRWQRFAAGTIAGLLPLALAAPLVPWWQFAQLHRDRGLQAESLYASFVWLAHQFGAAAEWAHARAGTEIHGALAARVLPIARLTWIMTVALSLLATTFRAIRFDAIDPPRFARLALVPLLAFVAFNFVLSPQYLIWLLGFLAVAAGAGWDWPLTCMALAIAAEPILYPTPWYFHGYDLSHALVLCARNLLLVAAWAGLLLKQDAPRVRQPQEV
jgi:hypothetical protein